MNINYVLYYKWPESLGDLQLLLSIKNTISERRRSKFRALRKRWMVKVGLSTRGIPPCYLLMILTNPHPPTYKHEKHKTHWVTAANTHTIQYTSIQRVQKQWRIKRDNLVLKSALSYIQFLCAYPYALLTLTLALFSHPPLNHIRVHYTLYSSLF